MAGETGGSRRCCGAVFALAGEIPSELGCDLGTRPAHGRTQPDDGFATQGSPNRENTASDSFRADSFVFQMFCARLSGTLLAVRRVLLVH